MPFSTHSLTLWVLDISVGRRIRNSDYSCWLALPLQNSPPLLLKLVYLLERHRKRDTHTHASRAYIHCFTPMPAAFILLSPVDGRVSTLIQLLNLLYHIAGPYTPHLPAEHVRASPWPPGPPGLMGKAGEQWAKQTSYIRPCTYAWAQGFGGEHMSDRHYRGRVEPTP